MSKGQAGRGHRRRDKHQGRQGRPGQRVQVVQASESRRQVARMGLHVQTRRLRCVRSPAVSSLLSFGLLLQVLQGRMATTQG